MIYAISDLHLSTRGDKPMNVFGRQWDDYVEKIIADWQAKVKPQDVVLLCGDLSWAMTLGDAMDDLKQFAALNGTKIIIRGNHDYWWNSFSKVRSALPSSFIALQNTCFPVNDYVICGTRLWTIVNDASSDQDRKIFERELIRLKLSLDISQNTYPDKQIILMTHYPPFGDGFKSSAYTELISRYNVKCVVYGHIHGQNSIHKKSVKVDGSNYLLSSCDLVGFNLIEVAD